MTDCKGNHATQLTTKTMDPHRLNIVRHNADYDRETLKQVAQKLSDEYEANKPLYERFAELRQSSEVTPANVRRATIWVVGSIKTDTQLVDSDSMDVIAGDFGDDRDFLLQTQDGRVKWDCYGEWFSSQIPDRVSELLIDGRVDDAHALLSGRDPDTGKRVGEHYLRANKASLVLYMLGFDRVCMDTRVYNALKPALGAMLKNDMVRHPESEDPIVGKPSPNPYRSSGPRQDAKPVSVLSHSGDDEWNREKSYWEDKLKWNPIQYDALTRLVARELAKLSDVPRELIPQVAFNTEGNTTIHAALMKRLN